MSTLRHWSGLCALAVIALGAIAAPAQAEFGISRVETSFSEAGEPTRQAGSHPDFSVGIAFPFNIDGAMEGRPQTVRVDLPPGVVGNPTAAPTCSGPELVGGSRGKEAICPPSSQVGVIRVVIDANENLEGDLEGEPIFTNPVYNMERPPGLPALFAANISGAVIRIVPTVAGADSHIRSTTSAISESFKIGATRVDLWGVPADSSHDPERFFPNSLVTGAPSSAPRLPFLSTPTECSGSPTPLIIEADSWEDSGVFDRVVSSADPEGIPFTWSGCERLRFDPSVTAQPLSRRAAGPTGLSVDLIVPQNEDPGGRATPHVRKVVTTFPRGVTLSSSAAAGLGSCAPDQIGLGSTAAPTCPDSSKVGTVRVETPLLDEDLEGDVIVAKQGDNPFGSLVALYLSIKGPGFYLKLPGKVDLDPVTGQLTTTFSDTPQLPFEALHLNLDGGPTAPLVAPSACGTYSTHVEMTSWASDVPVELEAPMTIDQGCDAGGFSPRLRAGSADPVAGSFSPFTLQVTRADGEQNLSRIDTTLPEGLLAKLAGVPLCGDAPAATGECPASSRIGKATVGVGAGSSPLYVPEAGKAPTAIYLAGPYKGAPYSLVVKVPAQAGPFDLGTVAVRSGIYIDPVTARASVKSDPLPQILQGIPIAYRDVRVEIDRAGFIRNPTSCEAMKVESTLFGSGGGTASPSARFQASDCAALAFKPKLALKFSGPTHRSAHPALKATLTMPKGGANIGKAVVTLPKTEFLENAHIRTICTRVQYAADNCPKESVYGYAKAWTPLLDKPLQGPVYLRSSNHTLPDLVASLDGQIHVDLAGRIDSPGGKIRNTFWAVPDAPVSKFVLTMQGGDKGLLVNNEELCKAKPRARAEFTGQNGKSSVSNPLVKIGCGKRK